jgi:hypothetical protein
VSPVRNEGGLLTRPKTWDSIGDADGIVSPSAPTFDDGRAGRRARRTAGETVMTDRWGEASMRDGSARFLR